MKPGHVTISHLTSTERQTLIASLRRALRGLARRRVEPRAHDCAADTRMRLDATPMGEHQTRAVHERERQDLDDDEELDCCLNHCDECGCMNESHYHCANCGAVSGMFGHWKVTEHGNSRGGSFTCEKRESNA